MSETGLLQIWENIGKTGDGWHGARMLIVEESEKR